MSVCAKIYILQFEICVSQFCHQSTIFRGCSFGFWCKFVLYTISLLPHIPYNLSVFLEKGCQPPFTCFSRSHDLIIKLLNKIPVLDKPPCKEVLPASNLLPLCQICEFDWVIYVRWGRQVPCPKLIKQQQL